MTRFPPLPEPYRSDGRDRRCGVEIEFAGPTEVQTAHMIADLFGGEVVRDGAHELIVKGTPFGDVAVELDTFLRKRTDLPFLEEGLDLVRGLVPVEVISPPLTRDQLDAFDTLCPALRKAGALGSRTGVLLGFGVHLNPETVSADHPFTIETLRAYGYLEPWLRRHEKVDATRSLTPFVDKWPKGLVSDLSIGTFSSLADVMRMAAKHIRSRNQSLDLLPMFKDAEPELFAELFDETDKTAARPTFHFRLPDSRIDEPDWSLAQAWALWRQVECTAAHAGLMADLTAAWTVHDAKWFDRTGVWTDQVDALLRKHDVMVAA